MEFTTRKCEVKKFIPEYFSIMYDSWGTDREVGMYLLGFKENMSLDEFKDYILNTYKADSNDISIIQDKETNKVIGYINLYKEDSRSKSVTLVLKKDKWNHGYGTEVLSKLAELEKTNGLGSLNGNLGDEYLYELEMIRVKYDT